MTSRSRFEKLMEPGYIGQVRTRNRIIKTASGGGFVEKDGEQQVRLGAAVQSRLNDTGVSTGTMAADGGG